MQPIYLDNNATTEILPEVAEAMRECYAIGPANPASQHHAGRRARQVLDCACETIANVLGADIWSAQPDRLIFTSGGTEANNLVLRGLIGTEPRELVISAIEHSSVAVVAESLGNEGWQVVQLPVNRHGVAQTDQLHGRLRKETALVSVMLGNNETGVLQPVEELSALCRENGVAMHTDAAQVVGKLSVDFRRLGVDALTCSAHKFHGPPGIGVLVLKHGLPLRPLHFGGHQQSGLRPGTLPIALVRGMAEALSIWRGELTGRTAHLEELRDRFEAALSAGWPEVVIHGIEAPRVPHTSCVSFSGLDRQALVMALDIQHVACSTGSACASGSSEPSPVLTAMGCNEAQIQSAIRFSFSVLNTADEVDVAVVRILRVCNDLCQEPRHQKMDHAPPASATDSL